MRATLLLVPLLLLASCGDPPNRLYGSMSQVYPLDFNTVRATLVGDQISVAYQRMSGQTVLGMTAKVTVSIGDIQPVGTIHFNQEPVANADITGWFHTTLAADAADPTSRTLNGNFQTKVEAL